MQLLGDSVTNVCIPCSVLLVRAAATIGRSANGQQGIRKDALDITNSRKFERGEDFKFNANTDPKSAFYMET